MSTSAATDTTLTSEELAQHELAMKHLPILVFAVGLGICQLIVLAGWYGQGRHEILRSAWVALPGVASLCAVLLAMLTRPGTRRANPAVLGLLALALATCCCLFIGMMVDMPPLMALSMLLLIVFIPSGSYAGRAIPLELGVRVHGSIPVLVVWLLPLVSLWFLIGIVGALAQHDLPWILMGLSSLVAVPSFALIAGAYRERWGDRMWGRLPVRSWATLVLLLLMFITPLLAIVADRQTGVLDIFVLVLVGPWSVWVATLIRESSPVIGYIEWPLLAMLTALMLGSIIGALITRRPTTATIALASLATVCPAWFLAGFFNMFWHYD